MRVIASKFCPESAANLSMARSARNVNKPKTPLLQW
jgi:hypothetical protein